MSEIVVLGAGAWGTALAIQAARAGNDVVLFARSGADAIAAARESPRLPGQRLPDQIEVTGDPSRVMGTVIAAVPTQSLRAALSGLLGVNELIVCAKGIETGSLRLPLEIAAEVLPAAVAAVLTGPNFAREIAAGLPAAAVIASGDADLRTRATRWFATPAFRVYGSDDPVGAQLGGAAKNVIAIAAGVVMGAGLGENARAALITRGLAELARLAVALGGRAETVSGLSGLGDLLLSCTSPTSRNYALGLALGRGESLEAYLVAHRVVVEGVTTAPALLARAQGVDMPICAAVAAVLRGRMTLKEAMAALLSRPRRDE
jgi:glycerol-3-phosphate dehydrogenase (NAD(P)+)